ncbi:hypothetical protein VP01_172g5 [Puccinia sorghi]|uniref:Uncharacterized protein n=1 Tax=Puccinia sorghi TaxID=27349 RepID=A0A0L6VFD5_9BASI|nr:hypothetical protein VP01_172g5 [Puccinia sorghi]
MGTSTLISFNYRENLTLINLYTLYVLLHLIAIYIYNLHPLQKTLGSSPPEQKPLNSGLAQLGFFAIYSTQSFLNFIHQPNGPEFNPWLKNLLQNPTFLNKDHHSSISTSFIITHPWKIPTSVQSLINKQPKIKKAIIEEMIDVRTPAHQPQLHSSQLPTFPALPHPTTIYFHSLKHHPDSVTECPSPMCIRYSLVSLRKTARLERPWKPSVTVLNFYFKIIHHFRITKFEDLWFCCRNRLIQDSARSHPQLCPPPLPLSSRTPKPLHCTTSGPPSSPPAEFTPAVPSGTTLVRLILLRCPLKPLKPKPLPSIPASPPLPTKSPEDSLLWPTQLSTCTMPSAAAAAAETCCHPFTYIIPCLPLKILNSWVHTKPQGLTWCKLGCMKVHNGQEGSFVWNREHKKLEIMGVLNLAAINCESVYSCSRMWELLGEVQGNLFMLLVFGFNHMKIGCLCNAPKLKIFFFFFFYYFHNNTSKHTLFLTN